MTPSMCHCMHNCSYNQPKLNHHSATPVYLRRGPWSSLSAITGKIGFRLPLSFSMLLWSEFESTGAVAVVQDLLASLQAQDALWLALVAAQEHIVAHGCSM